MADEEIRHLTRVGHEIRHLTRRQLCEFLKGIEGFDNDRAAECAGLLRDAHYDTIGLLKMATKHDLVLDVGLKPGDALRIVSAAKGAVQPPPSPASSLPSSAPIISLPRASESHKHERDSPERSVQKRVRTEEIKTEKPINVAKPIAQSIPTRKKNPSFRKKNLDFLKPGSQIFRSHSGSKYFTSYSDSSESD